MVHISCGMFAICLQHRAVTSALSFVKSYDTERQSSSPALASSFGHVAPPYGGSARLRALGLGRRCRLQSELRYFMRELAISLLGPRHLVPEEVVVVFHAKVDSMKISWSIRLE